MLPGSCDNFAVAKFFHFSCFISCAGADIGGQYLQPHTVVKAVGDAWGFRAVADQALLLLPLHSQSLMLYL